MDIFEKARWIWPTADAKPDEYAEFVDKFDFSGEKAEIYVSADSNYVLYVNGVIASVGQYADFPYSKVYDRIDITKHLYEGENSIAVCVWYYGIDTTSTYYPGTAGLIYSLYVDGDLAAYSSKDTHSRLSPSFVPHRCKSITSQLGLSFEYLCENSDDWQHVHSKPSFPFGKSCEIEVNTTMRERTCKRLQLAEISYAREVSGEGITPSSRYGVILDFGKETVGYLSLKLIADTTAPITVAFGEHIVDGRVRRLIGGRDFSFVIHPSEGFTVVCNMHRRIGCRYVEIISDEPISYPRATMFNYAYPVDEYEPPENLTPLEAEIYEACVYTLKCCMHEHYEDCPWREQALYTMDSRNQMLAGYYAFRETLFPKANLELISEDDRPDGLLSICYPIKRNMAIPSFSLHFVTACEEYLRYSKDEDFIRSIYPKIKKTLCVFLDRLDDNGLTIPFKGDDMWNFYEWEDGLDGVGPWERDVRGEECYDYDLVLNSLISIAISRMISINGTLGIDSSDLIPVKQRLNSAIKDHFYNAETGLFETRRGTNHYSRLANSLVILAGVTEGEKTEELAQRLRDGSEFIDASLSMRAFLYDALILANKEKYSDFILSDIARVYEPMLRIGNGTVWETELGESDFDNAGSLCHGWSAIPIYYYNILK